MSRHAALIPLALVAALAVAAPATAQEPAPATSGGLPADVSVPALGAAPGTLLGHTLRLGGRVTGVAGAGSWAAAGAAPARSTGARTSGIRAAGRDNRMDRMGVWQFAYGVSCRARASSATGHRARFAPAGRERPAVVPPLPARRARTDSADERTVPRHPVALRAIVAPIAVYGRGMRRSAERTAWPPTAAPSCASSPTACSAVDTSSPVPARSPPVWAEPAPVA